MAFAFIMSHCFLGFFLRVEGSHNVLVSVIVLALELPVVWYRFGFLHVKKERPSESMLGDLLAKFSVSL